MGSFPYPFNSVPSDLTQAASWLQSNFQDAADTAYVDAEIAAASLATAAGVQANLDAHIADSTDAHDASAISVVDTGGYYSSADVEGSLQEVGADVDAVASGLAAHLADTTDAHDASAISILDAAGDFTATEVEGALAELQSDAEADAAALAAHIADTTDAHDASAISYAGGTGMSATDVESALDELATEKANAADLAVTQAEVDAVEVDLAAHEAETSTAHGGFYTQTQSNARFVNIDGDTMTGDLAIVEGSNAVVLSADSIQFGAGTVSAGAEWGLDLFGTGIWGGAAVDSLDVGFERLTPGVLSITSGDELDMTPGTLRVDTQAPLDNSTKSASTAYVDAAVTAGAALTITESGIIIPSGVTTVQHALRNVEAYVQNLEETFEQHHHDERYSPRRMDAAETYVGVFNYLTTAYVITGSVSFVPRSTRKIRVAASGSWGNYGSGITLNVSFKFQIAGVDYTIAVNDTIQNNMWASISNEFFFTPTQAQVGTTVTVNYVGAAGAHPAIGSVDLRIHAHEA